MSDKIIVGNFGDVVEMTKPALDEALAKASKAGCIETTTYDENGEVIVSTVRKAKHQNGSGFVISYTAKMCDFLTETRQGSVVRLFLYLAHNQNYGTDGKTFGYRCSHKYLQQVLGLDKKSIYNAFAYLKAKFLVVESRVDGATEFMVNPNYITIGTDKKTRMRVWNQRWEEFFREGGQLPQLKSK